MTCREVYNDEIERVGNNSRVEYETLRRHILIRRCRRQKVHNYRGRAGAADDRLEKVTQLGCRVSYYSEDVLKAYTGNMRPRA